MNKQILKTKVGINGIKRLVCVNCKNIHHFGECLNRGCECRQCNYSDLEAGEVEY